jgi:predicted nucleic acid-binding Zn ribbon protein
MLAYADRMCNRCEVKDSICCGSCFISRIKDGADLINRQKGEIERLRKYTEEPSPAPNNTCICCGEIIPEGRQVCPSCGKQLKNYKLKGVKTKTIGKYVAPDMGVQLTIDDIGE